KTHLAGARWTASINRNSELSIVTSRAEPYKLGKRDSNSATTRRAKKKPAANAAKSAPAVENNRTCNASPRRRSNLLPRPGPTAMIPRRYPQLGGCPRIQDAAGGGKAGPARGGESDCRGNRRERTCRSTRRAAHRTVFPWEFGRRRSPNRRERS